MWLKTFLGSVILAGAVAYGPSSLHADTASDLEAGGCGEIHPTNFVRQAECLDEWKKLVQEFTSLHHAKGFFVEFWDMQIDAGKATSARNPVAITIYNFCRSDPYEFRNIVRDRAERGEDFSFEKIYELAKNLTISGARRSVNCLRDQEQAARRLGRIESASFAKGLPPVPKGYRIDVAKLMEAGLSPPPAQPISQEALAAVADDIRRQVVECWSVPPNALDAPGLPVKIAISLNPDGSLRSQPRILDQARLQDPVYRVVAESARRAVLRCSPFFTLPYQDEYEAWKDVVLSFDPRDVADLQHLSGRTIVDKRGGPFVPPKPKGKPNAR